MVTTTTPGGQRVSICTCTRTGRHLGTFTRRPGSSLYTLTTEPPHVVASAQVSASGPVAAPCSCRLLSHQTLLWQHRLGHPSLARLHGMHSCLLVSGLSRSLPPLPPSLALPCLPCVEGQQRAAPHSSSFPPTTAPLQILHMDVWGLDRVIRLQLRERFREDLPVLCLHSDRGGEFVSDLFRDFCCEEGIVQSFTLPASPQQNGVAERRIGLVMEVARTSMIHAAAPHFLWPFAVRYVAHQLNFWPCVSLPETSPTLCWTGKVGDASVFWVWVSRAFVRDASAEKLSSRAIPCVFIGFPPDAPGWEFYHPTSRRVLPSQDVTFDESVPFYCLFPYCTAPLAPPPLFLAPGPPPVDSLPPQGPALSCVSQVDPLPGTVPAEVAVDSGAARGAASGGAETASAELGGAEPGGAKRGGTEPKGAKPGGAESEGAESGGAEARGTASAGGVGGSPARGTGAGGAGATSPGRGRTRDLGAGGAGAGCTRGGGAGASSRGGAGVTAGARGTGGAGAAGHGGARTKGTGAARAGGIGGTGGGGVGAGGAGVGDTGAGGARARGPGAGDPGAGGAGAGGAGAGGTRAGGAGAGGAGAGGAGAGDRGAEGAGAKGAGAGGTDAGGTVQRRPFFVPPLPSSLPPPESVLRQVLSLPSSTVLPPSLLSPPPHQSQPQLQPDCPMPAPSPYAEQTYSFTERRQPESCPNSPIRAVCTGRCVPCPCPPPIPGTHIMALRPSSIPL
ncbi:unnamed protein product, partial [Closterium sp. NIES-54]